jgi:hypothetical protein
MSFYPLPKFPQCLYAFNNFVTMALAVQPSISAKSLSFFKLIGEMSLLIHFLYRGPKPGCFYPQEQTFPDIAELHFSWFDSRLG